MSFKNVRKFENKIAKFFGAPYAIAVDSCTHGIELCLRYNKVLKINVPKRTYISIPFLAKKLNIKLNWVDNKLMLLYYGALIAIYQGHLWE
jgi:dTDP-4-amino-4,6-dideoxygalactose transaminase